MNPTTPPSKSKRSVRKFLRENVNKVFRRSPSPSAPQQASQASQVSNTQPSSSPPSTNNQSSATALTNSLSPVHHALVPVPSVGTQAPVGPGNVPPTVVISSPATNSSSTNANTANQVALVGAAPSTSQQATSGVWVGLGTALRSLHKNAGLLPPLQSAIGTFVSCLDVLEEAARNRHEYDDLASEITSLAGLLAEQMTQSSSARMSHSIANVARSLEEQAKQIEKKRSRGAGRRLVESNADEELGVAYRRIGSLFRQLQADANLSIWGIVNDQMANTRLEGLTPAKLANHDSKLSVGISRRACTANTRTAILSGLDDWSNELDAANLYWMNGMAGTGKTTIAYTFSEALEESKQLAATFFCTRTVPECREAGRIIPTIAYQLARYSVPFRSALCEELAEDPDAGSRNLQKQFDRLLKRPLLQVKEAMPNNLVVVIDALDECDDMVEVELLLSLLLKSVSDLPLKFFVTSRPEPEIYNRMLNRVQSASNILHLHEVEKSLVQADIEVYLTEELEFMSPTPAQIQELARRSGNLFIYAATIVRYIRSRKAQADPEQRLQSVLSMTSAPAKQYAQIDTLYAAVLTAAVDEDSEDLEIEEIEDVRRVLKTAICIQEPVSLEVLTVLAGLKNERRTLSALQPLRAVLYFSESSGLVSILHASFSDFMFDETRSKSFFCNLAEQSGLLTRQCLGVMNARLRFNICKLESSFVADRDVKNLENRVKQAVSSALWYSCRYWGEHLRQSAYSDSLCILVNEFLLDRLLFWMEVLNLKGGIGLGAEILQKATLWLKVGAASADVVRLAQDAQNFVTTFATNPVSRCTPHIYISSLPFCPKSSTVFQRYWKKIQGLINVTGPAIQRREVAALASWASISAVLSVAYSPDGSNVLFGFQDGTFSVRSAHDGTLIAGPFEGHAKSILSVAYSPDGTRIVTGSDDNTIRVWNSHDGTPVAGPFEGHTKAVLSVGYSPDGTRIVSSSGDSTIRVWSVHDSTLVAGPFEGHAYQVMSVAFSPDGTRIVSGSQDHTIRVWSAHDGTLVAGPFEGHNDWVMSVAYSPDGTCIASGSRNNIIQVWSAHDGTLVAGPFEGHSDSVTSVAFSPDGTRIASGSRDHTVRIWNSSDGSLVAGPFEGHSHWVLSIAFSPDGTRVVSGSDDKTVRVWSAHDGAVITHPAERHIYPVWSVAYSPDGTHIASGSHDGTVRIWDAHDGKLVAGPFEGHTGWVFAVAYSPDGSHIASSAADNTIRIWNAYDGTLVAGPFEGHTDWIFTMTYSPDGTRIVSGSNDKSLRVWSAHDGALLAGPLERHTDSVASVAFSPDGTHIVSSSNTIQVCSAHDGKVVAGPFEGHTDSVLSVAYSPDGARIASGSEDKTIRVWSACDGTSIAGPLEGHADSVTSVKFSPDGMHIVSGSRDPSVKSTRPN